VFQDGQQGFTYCAKVEEIELDRSSCENYGWSLNRDNLLVSDLSFLADLAKAAV
ncbi:unnamed protein product, partial [Acidithrix sp. C25]